MDKNLSGNSDSVIGSLYFHHPPKTVPYPPPYDNDEAQHKKYKATSPKINILKTSQRFIPIINNAPYENNPNDPPYLFSFKQNNISEHQPSVDDQHEETIGINNFPCNSSEHAKMVHQELLIAYYAYLNSLKTGEVGRSNKKLSKYLGRFGECETPKLTSQASKFISRGYLDENGIYHRLKPGETIPPNGILVTGNSLGLGIQAIESGILPQGSSLITVDKTSEIPRELYKYLGYVDENGIYHRLKPGQTLPPNGILLNNVAGFIDRETLEIHPIKSGTKIPEGSSLIYEAASIDKTAEIQPGLIKNSNLGYVDEDGIYHRLKHGQTLPPNYILLTNGGGFMDREIPHGLIKDLGYVDENEIYHRVKPGQTLPPNMTLLTNVAGFIDRETLKIHPIESGTKLPEGSTLIYQPTTVDKTFKIPSGVIKDSNLGYVDENGIYHRLKPGQTLPPNAILLTNVAEFMDKETMEIHAIGSGTKIPEGSSLIYKGASIDKTAEIPPGVRKDSNLGYLDENGIYHRLKPGQTLPPNATLLTNVGGFRDRETLEIHGIESGTKLPEGSTLIYQPTTVDKTFKIPPGLIKDSNLGYVDENGIYHRLKPGQTLPPNAILLTNVGGFMDKETLEIHAIGSGTKIPQGSSLIYKDASIDKTAEIPPGAIKDSNHGYVDENGIYHRLKPGQTLPPNATLLTNVAGFMDRETLEIHGVESGTKLPDASILIYQPTIIDKTLEIPPGVIKDSNLGYVDENVIYHRLKPGQTLPPNGILLTKVAGFIDRETLGIHAIKSGTKIPEGSSLIYQPINIDESQDIPPGVIKDSNLGYVDENGIYHRLKPGQTRPPNGILLTNVSGFMDRETSEIHEIKSGTKIPEGSSLIYQPTTVDKTSEVPPGVVKDSNLGYVDENGIYHRLKPGQTIPPNGISLSNVTGFMDSETFGIHGIESGTKLPEGSTLIYQVTTIDNTPETPPGVIKDSNLNYVDENGVYHTQDFTDKHKWFRTDSLGGGTKELTEDEKKRLREFMQNVAVQCGLELADGSSGNENLDSVFRKTFQLYEHGGSIVGPDGKKIPPSAH